MRRLIALLTICSACASEQAARELPPPPSAPTRPRPVDPPAPAARPDRATASPTRPALPPEPDSEAGYRGLDAGTTGERLEMAYDRGDMPLAVIPREHPALPFLKSGSVSVGTSRDGYLVRGAVLPLVGEHYRVITTQASRGTNHGAEELIAAIVAAADAVDRQFPGAVLQVGNIARGGGGDIPWSVSHNSGRDADLGFYVNRVDGSQFMLTDLVRLDARGVGHIAGEEVRFDAPKTWALVKALLTNPAIRLQYLFVSTPLKNQLLAVAKRRKESEALLARANEILRQPVGAAPHDDHVHVRILCPTADLAEGCVESLKLPEGYEPPMAGRASNIVKARKHLRADTPDERRSAAHLLQLLGAREAASELVPLVHDEDASVRLRAVRALVSLDEPGAVPAIGRQLAVEPDPRVAAAEVDALARLGGRAAITALRAVVSAGRVVEGLPEPTPLRRLAAKALKLVDGELDLIRTLVAALDDPDDTTRQALLEALSTMTNQVPVRIAEGQPPPPPAEAKTAWEQWLAANGRSKRAAWVIDGFKQAGLEMRKLDKRAAAALCDAIRAGEPVSTNAVRALIAITRHRATQSLGWARADRYAYWHRWLRRHGFLGRHRR